MHLVGETTRREIMHGVTKVDATSGLVDPRVITSEYLKSMAALGLAAIERRLPTSSAWAAPSPSISPSPPPSSSPPPSPSPSPSPSSLEVAPSVPARPLRCLFLGLGAGALPKLLAHHLPGVELVAVECDDAVCDAASRHLGLNDKAIHIARADAIEWVKDAAAAVKDTA